VVFPTVSRAKNMHPCIAVACVFAFIPCLQASTCDAAVPCHSVLMWLGAIMPGVSGKALSQQAVVRMEVFSHGNLQVIDHQDNDKAPSDSNLVTPELDAVVQRMHYWSTAHTPKKESRPGHPHMQYLLFDIDKGGLNNIRIGWEVAGVIAYHTGRTLVLPPAVPFYMIDWGGPQFKPVKHGTKSRVEDFVSLSQLKSGLPTLTFAEFRAQASKALNISKHMTDQEVLDSWQDRTQWETFSADNICELNIYNTPAKAIYIKQGEDAETGRIFVCSEWTKLGTPKMTLDGQHWTVPEPASSLLKNNFIWNDEVFQLAALIVQDLGIFQYNALHARYGDFQFKEARNSGKNIGSTWFESRLGHQLFRDATLYVATDDTTDALIESFRSQGINAKWSKDYFQNPHSPIADLLEHKGAVRVNQLKGPVEQLVCAFGRIFVGTRYSTFSGYINQLRIYADAPQHGPLREHILYHSDHFSPQTVQAVTQQVSKWESRAGGDLMILKKSKKVTGKEQMPQLVWLAVLALPLVLWISTSSKTTALSVCMCYTAASVSMNVLNKEAASNFPLTFLLVAIQMLFADIVIVCVEFNRLATGSRQDLAKWLVVACAFSGMLGTSMWVFKETTLTTILITRNILPLLSLLAEKYFFDTPKSVPISILLSLACVLVGSVVYGYGDVSITRFGEFLIMLNCIFTLVDRLLQTQYLKRTPNFSISLPCCMLLNNTIGIVPMMVFACTTGEIAQWKMVLTTSTSKTWLWVIMSSGCGACLGYVGLRAQKLVSGTTILVIQNLNKLLVLFLGSHIFGDRFTTLSLVGCIVSMTGCFWYGYLRLPAELKDDKQDEKVAKQEGQHAKQEEKEEAPSETSQ